jgi:hypothetical protein
MNTTIILISVSLLVIIIIATVLIYFFVIKKTPDTTADKPATTTTTTTPNPDTSSKPEPDTSAKIPSDYKNGTLLSRYNSKCLESENNKNINAYSTVTCDNNKPGQIYHFKPKGLMNNWEKCLAPRDGNINMKDLIQWDCVGENTAYPYYKWGYDETTGLIQNQDPGAFKNRCLTSEGRQENCDKTDKKQLWWWKST